MVLKNDNVYHSQFYEDKWLIEHCYQELPDKGFFVDVGAGPDGINISNTYIFEQQGWNGICIDADPRTIPDLKKNRSCVEEGIVDIYTGDMTFYAHKRLSDISAVNPNESENNYDKLTIPSRPLQSILEKYGAPEIDLLSIDVEGEELHVMDSFDQDFYKPKFIIIEYKSGDPKPSQLYPIIEYFRDRPYKVIYMNEVNLIFKRI